MKLSKKKIAAWIILIAAYLIPFRYAYLTPTDTGMNSMINFLFVAAAVVIFAMLNYSDESEPQTHN